MSTWGAWARGPEHRAELGHEGEEAGKRMGKRRTSQAGATGRAQAHQAQAGKVGTAGARPAGGEVTMELCLSD